MIMNSATKELRFSIIFGVIALLSCCIQLSNAAFAQGSLQLVFHPKNGKSSSQHPLTTNLNHLWCQAAENLANGLTEKVAITKAHFLHFETENPDKSFTARIVENRAFLDLGTKDLFAAGKYRCELTTENDEFVYGNMFIYMRPVFHTNGSMRLDLDDEKNRFELTGSSIKATKGTTAVVSCPAHGYPTPEIHWFKNQKPLQETEKYRLIRNELHILDVSEEDQGNYRCIASNEFPPAVDFKEVRYEAILDQQLRVTSSLSWLIPLIVIILILIILFVIIYTCAYLKKREAQRYNVSSQEKKLHNAEQQRLREIEEEE
ncbi:Ig-like domain-containing protein [Aphelenchoides bicaudatus]|nr:Ig-like domain-containing protein [Aphelenchoides bicaudatus]